MKEPPEQTLKVLFRMVRQTDEAGTPSFDTVLERRHRAKAASRRRSLGFALAGASVCIVLAIFALLPRNRSSSDAEFVEALRTAQSIAHWTAPTDVLLVPPHPGLVRDIPEIGGGFYNMKENNHQQTLE